MEKKKKNTSGKIWANLLHLGYNMWRDRDIPERGKDDHTCARPFLRFDTKLWDDLLKKMVDVGMNMVVIDLGEGVKYKTHPEIAVRNSWTGKRLRNELSRIRQMGLEPIPKLNFSTCHDTWLGNYHRCVSTDTYYKVCKDLIAEVIDLFDKPRFFHLGMDEETASHQRYHAYAVLRQYDLWWHDLYFYFEQVERKGVRPWIWSDYVWNNTDVFYKERLIWNNAEMFFKKMPRSAVQSNWYYSAQFDEKINYVKAYLDLEAHGYDQIPTGSNWSCPENFGKTVAYCRKYITPQRLLGFLQTPWKPTLKECRQHHIQAIELAGQAIKEFA